MLTTIYHLVLFIIAVVGLFHVVVYARAMYLAYQIQRLFPELSPTEKQCFRDCIATWLAYMTFGISKNARSKYEVLHNRCSERTIKAIDIASWTICFVYHVQRHELLGTKVTKAVKQELKNLNDPVVQNRRCMHEEMAKRLYPLIGRRIDIILGDKTTSLFAKRRKLIDLKIQCMAANSPLGKLIHEILDNADKEVQEYYNEFINLEFRTLESRLTWFR